jgi:hypothetical protein
MRKVENWISTNYRERRVGTTVPTRTVETPHRVDTVVPTP